MSDETTEPVQPDVGQGGEADGAPYAEYLSRIPEEVRGDVEPVFKDWDANTTRRFQEHAEYKRGWEPYEQLGVQQLDPAELQWLLQFREAQQNSPQDVWAWAQQFAEQNGLTQAEAVEQFDQNGLGQEGYGPEIQQLLEQQLQQHLSPFTQQLQNLTEWQQQTQQQAAEQQALEMIQGQVSELKSKHGDEFNEEMVEKLIANHLDDPDHAVELAFKDWQAISNQISRSTLQSKVDAPKPAEAGGGANANPDEFQSMKERNAAAIEMLRQQRGV